MKRTVYDRQFKIVAEKHVKVLLRLSIKRHENEAFAAQLCNAESVNMMDTRI